MLKLTSFRGDKLVVACLLAGLLAPSDLLYAQGSASDGGSVEEEVPAARQSLLRSTRTRDYNQALSFGPEETGLLLPPAEIEYDLSLNGGRDLRIGNILFSEKTFVVTLRSLNSVSPALARELGPRGTELSLILRWPEALMPSGSLEMISRTGTVLWKYDVTEAQVEAWKKQLGDWREILSRQGAPSQATRGGLFATQLAISDLKALGAPLWDQRETFRFCLARSGPQGQSRICTRRMGVQRRGSALVLAPLPFSSAARVVVMNQNAPEKGVVPVPADTTAQFYADLASGESVEFVTPPPNLDLVDLSDTSKRGTLRVSGFGVRPVNPHLILNPDQYGRLTVLLGFEPTIGDTRKFWAAALKERDPKLYFPGPEGGVFRQRFQLAEIPRAAARPHLHRQTPKGTYVDGAWLTGRKLPTSKVESKQLEARAVEGDENLFYWKFEAKKKGQINRSYLTVSEGGKSYRSYFELYRAYANELSVRASGVAGSSNFLFLGEVAYNHWFENLLWWDQYWLTKQRWGLSAKSFTSLNQLPVGAGQSANLSVTNVDLKYRLTPGLWTRDETLGAMLSYQDVVFGDISAPMLGVGAFWARSMPRAFDELFNYLPYMNYPKWVDMEFIYFVNPLKANVQLAATMALNFHGQVLWRDNFFGEAGFGFKRYAIRDNSINRQAALNTIYGTVGLGFKF